MNWDKVILLLQEVIDTCEAALKNSEELRQYYGQVVDS
jgi:hypothetical protein